MRTFSGAEEFKKLSESVVGAYKALFPVEKNGHKLEADKIWMDADDVDPYDYAAQKKIKLAGGTFGIPLYASLTLKDPTGKVIDRLEKIRIASVPRITPRRSYIVGGNEYQVANQMIRKPGAYIVRSQKGDTFKGMLAIGGKNNKNIDIELDPESNQYKAKIGSFTVPLYPLVKALGATDQDLIGAWGEGVFKANKRDTANHYTKLADQLAHVKTDNQQTAIEAIQEFMKTTKVDPKVTELTLGKGYDSLSKALVVDTSKKLLKAYQGEVEPDDPENLLFKEIRSVEDMVHDRLSSEKEREGLKRMLSRHLGKRTSIKQMIDFRKLTSPVETFFTMDNRTSTPEQYNPVHMLSESSKLTIHGTGGIESEHAVSANLREVHPSHIGFVDPVHTPESDKTGTTVHLAAGVQKNGREINTMVYNPHNQKIERLTPRELHVKTVAFPDEMVDGKFIHPAAVRVQRQGKVMLVPQSDVDAVLPTPVGMFSHATNLIPFLKNNQGARAAMASKMLGQALPLVHREAPLVQTELAKGMTFHQAIGEEFTARSPVAGKVMEVTKDFIRVGKDKVPLYNNFPLNQKTHLHHEAIVKVGDTVKEGQLLADSNFTKDGTLALGKNLSVAYLPIPGHTFEDGIVITESAAKKLSAEQTNKHTFKKEEGKRILDFKKWIAYYGSKLDKATYHKLDKDGVIQKGTHVNPGDMLIAGLSNNLQSPENSTLKKINKSLMLPWADSSVSYSGEFPGVVTDVVNRADGVYVYVKSEEPARASDKLSGVHGNKGVISAVIPDHEAPRDIHGNVPDVFINPHGIIGRINLGQMYESAAAKIAKKTGKPYVVKNFDDKNSLDQINAELKKHGLTDTETLYDPSGKKLGEVSVGNPYILRLAKTGKTGFSARMPGSGYDNNLQPLKGGEEGTKSLDALTFYSMLSHGAKKNLIDAHQKSERNDEFWHAVETGKPVPAPKTSFAWEKFINLIRGAGINVDKRGTNMVLSPMTDKEVLKISKGQITEPQFLVAKNMKEVKGGFFDEAITGGLSGNNYSHMELPERMPNPVFEDAIKSLTGLKSAQYEGLVEGTLHLSPKTGNIMDKKEPGTITGGAAVAAILAGVNVEGSLTRDKALIKKLVLEGKHTELDRVNRRIRYLSALKDLHMTADEAYTRKNVPIVPPKYRPVQEVEGRGFSVAPSNYLYQNLGLLSKAHDYPVMKLLDDSEKKDLRGETYKATRALAGLEPVLTRGKDQPIEGFISQIKGSSPKTGFFLSKLITKKQDLVGRGVITNGPELHVDQLGIPEKMAWKIFRPFILREFIQSGFKPEDARKEVDEQSDRAHKMMESVVKRRTVLMNRAPSLHKFSVMAFKPVLTDGLSIQVPPLVYKGFNADIDGDCCVNSITYAIPDKHVSTLTLTHGEEWVRSRTMAARYKTKLPFIKDHQLMISDLSEFPKDSFMGTVVGTNGDINFYHTMNDIKVLTVDEKTGDTVWAKVSHWSEHPNREIEIVSLRDGSQIVTDNDPRAVYGIPSGSTSYGRFRPSEAVDARVLVPKVREIKHEEVDHHIVPAALEKDGIGRIHLNSNIPCDKNVGYLLGALAGDGWVDADKGICLASLTDTIANKVDEVLQTYFSNQLKAYKKVRDTEDYGPNSIKYTWSSAALARTIDPLIGHLAENKHLPPFFHSATVEFKLGLLAGLLDTDGCIQWGNAVGKNPQLMVTLQSNSLRLIQEITHLCRSLGIQSGITATKTPLGKPSWVANINAAGLQEMMPRGYLQHPTKHDNLYKEIVKTSSAQIRWDVVPAPSMLMTFARKTLGAPRDADKETKTIYAIMSKSIDSGYITRDSAIKLIDRLGEKLCAHPDYKFFLKCVLNTNVGWEPVVSYEKTGVYETGYDLTVPGYETFMAVDGTILSNTVTVHVPVSDEALRESVKMFPSNNLWKPGTGELMLVPSQEAAIGMYFLSNTAEGRARLNKLMPAQFHVTGQLDAKKAKELFDRIAKEDPQQFANIVHELKSLGDKHAYDIGFSATLKDLQVDTHVRDQMFAAADKQAAALKKTMKAGQELDNKISDLYEQAAKEAYDKSIKPQMKSEGSNFYHMIASGARGKDAQLQQLVSAPGIMLDAKNRKVPVPVKKSYAEGLATSDYFISSYGVRKGMMDRALQTSKPGALNKDILATTVDNIITMDDCGVKKGYTTDIGSKDVYGRYLANDQAGFHRNDLVTPQMISEFKRQGQKLITVRSPLKCLAPKGTCAHCFGHDEFQKRPEIGDNIGAKMGQTMSEPVTQFVMRTFHTGGVSGGSNASGYDRVNQLLSMPKYLPGEAAMSPVHGTISKITKAPAGGHIIHIGNEEVTSRPGHALKVKVGDKVASGDLLTEGTVKPQNLAQHKGMAAAQDYIVDELQKTYAQQGVQMDRKVFETVVRSLANQTEVIGAPHHSDFLPGDLLPFTVAQHYNETRKVTVNTEDSSGYHLNSSVGRLPAQHEITDKDIPYLKQMGYNKIEVVKDPLVHKPVLKSIRELPFLRKDWLAQMGYQKIKNTLSQGAAQQWKSNVEGNNPVPAFAYGATFGRKKEHY